MRNEEKHALRRELRRARAQMGHQGRLAAGQTINRLLKRYIKRGRKIGVYWPMGKELRLDGFVRAAPKPRCKTLSALYRTAFAADVVYAVS
ncbi:5-formyltetrahydrofolate cyclo-ligase [Neisseria meningitidis]|nr:5-formyltetrahydrofolate cyclo-ligase [Neisseria meningitidis]